MSTEAVRDIETPGVILHLKEQDLYQIDPETGEVLGMRDAPEDIADIESIARFYKSRKARVEAQKAAITAERDYLLKEIADSYDPLLKQKESALRWLDIRYMDRLRSFSKEMIGSGAKRSFRFAGLMMGFRHQAATVNIADEQKAIDWLKANRYGEILRTKYELLKTALSPDIRAKAIKDKDSGIVEVPAEDRFYIQ